MKIIKLYKKTPRVVVISTLVLFIIAVLASLYFVFIRPAIVRSSCINIAYEIVVDNNIQNNPFFDTDTSTSSAKKTLSEMVKEYTRNKEIKQQMIDVNNQYRQCLINHGIKPESAFINL